MLTPLIHASVELQIHVAAATLSMLLAPLQILRRRRDRLHKMGGYLWVTAMAVTAISSFWLRDFHVIGEFSPIHVLSVVVLVGLGQAIHAARRGDIDTHRRTMRNLAVWGLGVAGLFTLVPGRVMSDVLFPSAPGIGFAGVAALALAGLVLYRYRLSRRRMHGS